MSEKFYKAFDKNLQCRGMQYEVGKEYTFDGEPIPCQQGFHYCKSIADCYNFYDMSEDTRICEVEPLGDIATDDEVKYCTNKIRIIAEIENPRLRSNLPESSSGYCNSGNRNSGDWNSGDWNSGVFNTNKKPTIKMFDAESGWTYNDWYNSRAYDVMANCPYSYSDFIYESDMTDEEKERHPEYKTIGGYIKVFIITAEDKQKWWDKLSESDKQAVYDLPNFDAEKFKECTGIEIKEQDK